MSRTPDNIIDFPRRTPADGADLASAHATMAAMRTAFLEAFRAWLRTAGQTRDDAEIEAEGTAAVLRQMVILETKGGGAG